MNIVSLKGDKNKQVAEAGSILKSKDNEFYILARMDEQFVAICLDDGAIWNDPENTIASATSGLTLVALKANIEITPA